MISTSNMPTPPTAEEKEIERQKRKKVLEATYVMYERTKKDAENKRKVIKDKDGNKKYSELETEKILLNLKSEQDNVVREYLNLGFTKKDLDEAIKKDPAFKKETNKNILNKLFKKETDIIKEDNNEEEWEDPKNVVSKTPKIDNSINDYIIGDNRLKSKENAVKTNNTTTMTNINKEMVDGEDEKVENISIKKEKTSKDLYDYVKLPSKGECYKEHFDKLKVSFLTAYDENMILSPSLYKEGEFISTLIKNKVLDDINTDNLVEGDAEAIAIWLRANAYGCDYPIVVTDPSTGKEFDTNIDLSKIKYKKFKLKGDENGYFEYKVKTTGDILKFRFLTNKDNKFLNKLQQKESNRINIVMLKNYIKNIEDSVTNNPLVEEDLQEKINELVKTINDGIIDVYDADNDRTFTRDLTDRLILQTISVNGNTDRSVINDYILNMSIKDASDYRKYISDNMPGVDYNIKVERPESLGGGFVETFLQFDQFIFINY